jgi:hypothetical protein
MVIAAGVCPELDQLKATLHTLPDHLNQVRSQPAGICRALRPRHRSVPARTRGYAATAARTRPYRTAPYCAASHDALTHVVPIPREVLPSWLAPRTGAALGAAAHAAVPCTAEHDPVVEHRVPPAGGVHRVPPAGGVGVDSRRGGECDHGGAGRPCLVVTPGGGTGDNSAWYSRTT